MTRTTDCLKLLHPLPAYAESPTPFTEPATNSLRVRAFPAICHHAIVRPMKDTGANPQPESALACGRAETVRLASVRAVIFDMDGLMFDTERLMFSLLAEAAKSFGYSVSLDDFVATVGVSSVETGNLLKRRFGAGFPYREIRERRIELERASFAARGIPEKPGLRELLDFIDGCALPMAVGTSTESRRALHALETAGLTGRFRAVVCGDQVPSPKPAPDIYRAAITALGVEPAQCLVLEDSPAGIRAAATAGAIPVLVPDVAVPDRETLALAACSFPDLFAVRTWLSG